MPTIATIGSYRIEIHTGREWNHPHVHVVAGGNDVIVSLVTLKEMGQVRFRIPNNVRKYLKDNVVSLLAEWDTYHGN